MSKLEKAKVICLMAPTASGKTALAIELVKRLPLEIISVDSAMVYRGLNIGAAKPSKEELKQAPHRLIDIRDPFEPYCAAEFREEAIKQINEIHAQGKTPLLVGGTMLYFKVLQQGIADLPSADENLRKKLGEKAKQKGWQYMHERLQAIDPLSAKRIHPNDPQRLQRALEVYEITGKPLSELWQQAQTDLPYEFINIGLQLERKILHQRIEQRFKAMLEQNFLDEVKALHAREEIKFELPAIKSVGYQQAWLHLEGKLSYDEMSERAIIATRQLAKRQMTWLNSWPDLKWFEALDDNLVEQVIDFLVYKLN